MQTIQIASGAFSNLLTLKQGSGFAWSAALLFHSMRVLSCVVCIPFVISLCGCRRSDTPPPNNLSSPPPTDAAIPATTADFASSRPTHTNPQVLEEEAKQRPKDARAQARWGSYLAEQGHYAEAMPFLKAATALKPDFVAAWHNLAICYENLGRIDLAVEALKSEMRIAPNLPREQIKLGYLCVQLDRFEEAEKAFRAARRLMPHSSEPLVALASVRYADYRYEEAEKLLKEAIALNPLSAAAYTNLGSIYFATSRLAQAEEALRKSIALQENSAAAWEMLGRVLAARKGAASQEEALRSLEKAVELSPASAQARYYLGDLYLRKGMWVQAEKNLLEAVQRDPYASAAWVALGRAQRGLGKMAEADYAQKHGIQLRRKAEEIRLLLSRSNLKAASLRRLAQLYKELGKHFQALDVLQKAVRKYPQDRELLKQWRHLHKELSADDVDGHRFFFP